MTAKEIIELKIKLAQNDSNHYNRQMGDLDKQILMLQNKKLNLAQKISKKDCYIQLLERDIENENN